MTKKMISCLLALALLTVSGAAFAESVVAVQSRVDAAYSTGQIDTETKVDLKATLDSARNATKAADYQSATEAYNLLAPSSLMASFNPFGS